MIWKTFLFSFFLNQRNNIKKCIFKATLSTETNLAIIYKNDTYYNKTYYSGYDERFNNTVDETELIYNISRFFYKQNLLKTLQQDDVSIITKLDYIHKYNCENNPSITSPNIQAGELWKDWNFDITI
jgi:hypothetical protein